MERTFTTEERIKRAEAIYAARRQREGVRIEQARVKVGSQKRDFSLFKKMVLQICICLTIYLIFYLIQHNNYIFSEDVLQKAKEILSYDINFQHIYEQASKYLTNLNINQYLKLEQENPENKEENKEEGQTDEEEKQETEQTEEQTSTLEQNDENIGGAVEVAETDNLSQEEKDVKEIKEQYAIVKPVTGTVTSRFGHREPTTASVPKEHTGLDIGATTGTVIKAAMDGTVTLASDKGDYGLHLKIENGDVMTIYAHCNKLYVKQGDTVKQGDEIAEVGNTGNTTGPHLHFEIRKDGRLVNPENILEF